LVLKKFVIDFLYQNERHNHPKFLISIRGYFIDLFHEKNIKMEKNATWHMEIEISHLLKIPFVSLGLPYNI